MGTPKPDDFNPDERFPDDWPNEKLRGKRRCLGWSRGSGRQCALTPQGQTSKCRFHGGSSKSGPESGTYIHGKRSKHLPTDLQKRWKEIEEEGAALDGIDDVIQMQLITEMAHRRVASGRPAELWDELADAVGMIVRGRAEDRSDLFAQGLNRVRQIVEEGQDYAAAEREWADRVDKASRVRGRVHKQKHREERTVTLRELFTAFDTLASGMAEILRKHEADPALTTELVEWVRSGVGSVRGHA